MSDEQTFQTHTKKAYGGLVDIVSPASFADADAWADANNVSTEVQAAILAEGFAVYFKAHYTAKAKAAGFAGKARTGKGAPAGL